MVTREEEVRRAADAVPQYDVRILRPLANYILVHHGDAALVRVAEAGGIGPRDLDGRSCWVHANQFEALLQAARDVVGDDDTFKTACTYRLAESYGAVRYALWATSPQAVLALAAKTTHLVTTNGTIRVLESTRTSMRASIEPISKISRLNCLVRQAQTVKLPTLWGLPPAHLHEVSCAAHGDDACVYELRWLDAKRVLPIAIGLLLGVLATLLVARLRALAAGAELAIPLLGALLGYVYELHRTQRANAAVNEQINEAVRRLAAEEGDARREVLELHRRQREWTRLLEEDTTERAAAFQQVVDQLEQLQHTREVTIRGFGHDLRNPLAILSMNTGYLRERLEALGADGRAVVDDLDLAIATMRKLIDDLMQVAAAKTSLIQLAPQRLDMTTITERLRRRLRALVYGREIRASVFRTREAPDEITTDPILFDRVIDNILTNAAKYTQRGSIVLEIDGTPDTVTLKVSDTGCGMGPEELEKSFQPGGSVRREKGSYGVGLSVVVQLLAQVGGRLEVMSKPNHGTTFWIHFPREVSAEKPDAPRRLESTRPALAKVVTIRKVHVA